MNIKIKIVNLYMPIILLVCLGYSVLSFITFCSLFVFESEYFN